jgi:hypothetical protein
LKQDDTVKQSLAKIRAAGLKPNFGMSWSSAVSIELGCSGDPAHPYVLEFMLDANGHIAGLRQTPIIGQGLYTDDVTFHTAPAP